MKSKKIICKAITDVVLNRTRLVTVSVDLTDTDQASTSVESAASYPDSNRTRVLIMYTMCGLKRGLFSHCAHFIVLEVQRLANLIIVDIRAALSCKNEP